MIRQNSLATGKLGPLADKTPLPYNLEQGAKMKRFAMGVLALPIIAIVYGWGGSIEAEFHKHTQ